MAWIVTIAGIDRTAMVRPFKELRLRGEVGAQTLDFRLLDTASSVTIDPEDIVRVEHDGVEVFEGPIKRRTYSRFGRTASRVIAVACADYNQLLDADVIDTAHRSVAESDKERITWLVQTFGTKGITAGVEVQELLAAMPGGEDGRPEQDFSGKTLRDAIDQVAKITGGRFYVDSQKRLHYFASEVVNAPFALSDNPDGVATFATRNLQLTDDSIDLVHRVLVRGAGFSVTRDIAIMPNPEEIISAVINDEQLTSVEQANAVGDAFLAEHGSPRREGSCEVLVPGIQPGMTVQITNAMYGLVAEAFFVNQVTINIESAVLIRYELALDSSPIDLAGLVGGTSRVASAAGAVADRVARQVADLSIAGANLLPNSSYESSGGWSVGAMWVIGFNPADPDAAFHGQGVARLEASGGAAESGELVSI